MKHLTCILLLIIISFSACRQDITYPSAMLQAEALMNIRPDSALILLESIEDTLTTLPEEARMYHQLLTIQAKDKQYITHTDDSLINRIVSFYENYGNNDRLMMAYFYQGSTYRDMNDAPRALKAFQQAVDLNVPNFDLLAKAYNQMGNLFMYQGLHDEVIRVNRKAIEAYLTLGKRNKISYAQRDIARMYDVKNMPDSALFYYKKACNTALTDGDSARYYGILGELGGYYYEIGNVNKAKQLLKSIESLPYIQNKTHIYTILGHIYEGLDKQDSAFYYYWNTLGKGDLRNEYTSLRELYYIEENKKNYAQATQYINKALILKDSIDTITQTEAIAQINALYSYQHTQTEISRLNLIKERQEKQFLILLLFLLVLILCAVAFYFVQKTKKQKELDTFKRLKAMAETNYATSLEVIHQNEEIINVLNEQLHIALLEKDQLKAEQLQVQQRKLQTHNEEVALLRKEKELRITALHRTSIYKEFKKAATDENINLYSDKSQHKWEILEEAIDKAYPNFMERLNMICPNLSAIDTKVCMLTKIGLSPVSIAKVLNYSRQGITNIRSRIHKRIQKIGGKYANFDDFIDSF